MSELCPHGKHEGAVCIPCAEEQYDRSIPRKEYIDAERPPTGLDAQYYDLPDNIKSAQDLIEYLGLNFANGNILKSLVRQYGSATKGTDEIYEAQKRFFFADRELRRVQRAKEVRRRLPDATEGDETP